MITANKAREITKNSEAYKDELEDVERKIFQAARSGKTHIEVNDLFVGVIMELRKANFVVSESIRREQHPLEGRDINDIMKNGVDLAETFRAFEARSPIIITYRISWK